LNVVILLLHCHVSSPPTIKHFFCVCCARMGENPLWRAHQLAGFWSTKRNNDLSNLSLSLSFALTVTAADDILLSAPLAVDLKLIIPGCAPGYSDGIFAFSHMFSIINVTIISCLRCGAQYILNNINHSHVNCTKNCYITFH
jgi:hypothetical protein